MDKLILNIFISSGICLFLYLITAIVIGYTDGININEDGIGILALMLYFIVPFISIHLIFMEGNSNER